MSDFWAGYLSGAIGIIIGNPLDVIKVRLQAGNRTDASTTTSHLSRFEKTSSLVRGLCRHSKYFVLVVLHTHTFC